MEKGGI